MADNDWSEYAMMAAHYYVSARFATLCGYTPVCANLMHHSVELLLKCALLKIGAVPGSDADVDHELKRKHSHRLKRLWADFKRLHSDENFSDLDRLIDLLDDWEEIRYPARGIAMSIEIRDDPAFVSSFSGPEMTGTEHYRFVLELGDVFVKRLWSSIGINDTVFPVFTNAERSPLVNSAYRKWNYHTIDP